MLTKTKYLFIIAITFMFTGCASVTESGYYWGSYSETYYEYIKAPSEQSVTNHLNELNDIVNVSEKKGLKVPPGIYAEIGYITAKRGDKDSSINYYRQEAEFYPESKGFIERLITDQK
ncbi:DUF4810 domain-containing protein [Shewanella sp. 4_MG-2023]|uniref:DUF4810 domain-containing protein n=1 Tax=Shewanella sp. 4_MG-2023 TaxID=3062652 RepID=UPI0026E43E89|nr:DUF4810 domain-containing protein [Shewanella sp. 4_MG-2023]MDO6677694.1 DUF4810 domain-containing protein [Shewanella sp. 4_MG-2023]